MLSDYFLYVGHGVCPFYLMFLSKLSSHRENIINIIHHAYCYYYAKENEVKKYIMLIIMIMNA